MSEFKLILCTCPDRENALKLAKELVTRQLAACVNLLDNISSCYQWQGEVQFDTEYQLVIKTMSTKVDDAFQLVLDLHPYETPEWLILDVASGSQDYLNWIRSTLK